MLRRTLFFLLGGLAVTGAAWLADAPPDTSAVSGLANPGFEDGVLDGFPSGWTVAQPVADVVRVVDSEGPSEFDTYVDLGNITVAPYSGQQMLRLGRPARESQNQERGANLVSQTFVAQDTSLSFALRAFSWEFRGNDTVSFDLTSGGVSVGTLAAPVVLPMGGGGAPCAALPCSFEMDAGGNGEHVDTGWVVVQVDGLTAGATLTLSYAVTGNANESHGTWAYFDSTEVVPSRPVARFSFAPTPLFEGETVEFIDGSFDPDAGDSIVSWEWVVEGQTLTSSNPLYIFSDEGEYEVTLTVTSSDGTTTTVRSGENAADGTPVPPVVVGNVDPVVNALNVEALAGEPAPLVARFADPGWADTHTAGFDVGGGNLPGSVVEDNAPAYGTGVVTAAATFAANTAGSATVTDDDGGSGSDAFDVTLIDANAMRHEPNNALTGSPVLESDGSYLSYLQAPGDFDVFELKLDGNRAITNGTQFLLTLRELPADYDIAVISVTPPGAVLDDAGDSGQTSFNTAPFTRSPFTRSPFTRSPFTRSPFTRSPFTRSGFTFEQLSLSQIGFTGVEGDEITGTDINLGELGLTVVEGGDVRMAAFSANRGLETDTVLVTADAGTRYFAVVVGANSEFSTAPYRLQVEASTPLSLETLLGSEACIGTPLVGAGQSTTSVVTLVDHAAPTTVFVTQRERLRAAFEMDDAEWSALLADLTSLAQHPAVAGQVLSMPSSIYDGWDVNPCSIDAANAVASSIRDIVQPLLAQGVQYVVFVGDDGIVPFRRVPDETAISNERDYVLDSYLRAGSPLFASIALGYNLTDDYYVDVGPVLWQGRELYVPDVPTGRLVETPGQISAQAQAFLLSDGALNPATGFVSGYDFFSDGSTVTAGALSSKLSTGALINDTWGADELRCKLLGVPVPGLADCGVPDVSGPNAHFTHYAGLSAGGFSSLNLDDFLSSSDVAGATGAGGLVFTIGCHAGFSAPDRDSGPPDAGLGVDPALDFPEAMAIQRALYVASTGYGLGDDAGLGGTELLMTFFASNLVAGNVGAGNALVAAKQQHALSIGAMTVYDEKSLIQTTLYGLPMYRVLTPGGSPAPAAAAAASAPTGAPPAAGLDLTLLDGGGTSAQSFAYGEETTPDGRYFTIDGLSTSTAARPRQPKVVIPVTGPGDLVHAAIPVGGTYVDTSPFDPVIARPTSEWEVGAAEPRVCLDSFWPAELATVNTLTTPSGFLQSIVATPGQFRCQSEPGDPVSGLERLYSSLNFEVLRCPSTDFVPPAVRRVDLMSIDESTVHVIVDAVDTSGIKRIVALRFSAGTIYPTMLHLTPDDQGPYPFVVGELLPGDTLVLLVEDFNCNVTTYTGKGANLSVMFIDAGPDRGFEPGVPEQFPVTIKAAGGLEQPFFFQWDFGDGTILGETLQPSDLTPDGQGGLVFTVEHTYANPSEVAFATVKVVDAAGAIALDAINVACGDTDADLLTTCAEATIGTNPSVNDTDGDGCADGEEVLNESPLSGGQRNPLDPWDYYDVNGDKLIDLSDTLAILAFFGDDGQGTIGNLLDRYAPNEEEPWRTAEGNDGIDLHDALTNLQSFGSSCADPP